MKHKRKRGGQPGNKNANGNQGGAPYGNNNAAGHGAPYGNGNAITHGLYSHTGIYATRPLRYEELIEEDKDIVRELYQIYGNIESVTNLFRVIKFENNITPFYALKCKNPYKALLHSTHILIREAKKYGL